MFVDELYVCSLFSLFRMLYSRNPEVALCHVREYMEMGERMGQKRIVVTINDQIIQWFITGSKCWWWQSPDMSANMVLPNAIYDMSHWPATSPGNKMMNVSIHKTLRTLDPPFATAATDMLVPISNLHQHKEE